MQDEKPPTTDAFARSGDPDTSHEAAEKMHSTKSEQAVLDALRETGITMTSLCVTRHLQDKAHKTGDSFSWSVSPRFKPLEEKGLIERCGRKTVINSSGRIASLTAWRIKKR